MPGKYNGEGITMSNFFDGPDGEYLLKITEAVAGTTQAGDPKVTVDYVIAEGPYKGAPILYHTVTFFKNRDSKGAGIVLKFLKSIGEPYEGNFKWDERRWIGRRVKAMIVMEVQEQGKNAGKRFPKIAWVNAPDDGQAAQEVRDDQDEVPF